MLNNKEIVQYSPVVTTILLEGATFSQAAKMIQTQSSADQSLFGWSLVLVALALWLNWYRLFTPEQKWAIRATVFGLVTKVVAIGLIVWFRL